MKRRIPILLLTFLLTFLFGSLTLSAADASPLALDATKKTVNIGESVEINLTGLNGQAPVWNSYNVNIATVDKESLSEDGKTSTVTIKGLRKGKTTISARVGLTRKTCTITVADPSVKLNKKAVTLYLGGGDAADTTTLKATAKGSTTDVIWSSSDETIATVENGTITAKAAGTAIITATTSQGTPKTASCTVTVKESSLSLNTTRMQLGVKGNGSSIKLTATVVGSKKKVEWTTSDKTIATVSNGKVTGKKEGKAIITATANGITKTCIVEVVDGIAINAEQVTLYTGAVNNSKNKPVGNSITLKTNASKNEKASLKWSSKNPKIAMVNQDGVVTAVGAGTTVISATLNDKTDTCVVTVKKSSITINDTDVSLQTKGLTKTYTLNYQVVGPSTAVTWKSSDTKVATVSKGKITAKKAGTTTITATANGIPAQLTVTVKDYTPSIKLNQNEYTLYTSKGNTVTLKATVDAPNKTVTWNTANSEVATVSNKGKVTAAGEGQTYIYATAMDGTLQAECLINVLESEALMKADGFDDAVHENSLYMVLGDDPVEIPVDVIGSSQSVTYTVKDQKNAEGGKASGIITVKKGVVTAKKVGTAIIEVKANGIISICHVTVHDTPCEHSKIAEDMKQHIDESCKKSGLKVSICPDCPYIETVEIPKLKHQYEGEGRVAVEPTCAKKGIRIIDCIYNEIYKCGSTAIETIDETEHTWIALPGDAANVAATCTEKGIAIESCSTCNITRQAVLPPLGHSYGKWTVIMEATKEKSGLKIRECDRCGDIEEKEIPPQLSYDVDDSEDAPESDELVWHDEFNGTSLNTADWNYELHEPGWVNNEKQAYVQSDENIYVKDGKLHIKAIKSGEGENATYTSGRINTQGKHDFTYGRFEAKVKVPSGKGFLPAFWMMPTDESYYGQWPKCGEIDIMEVLGSKTDTAYGTLHFGEPHTESQGSYTLAEGVSDFAEDFHVYACEWEPGEIRFYVDGILFHKANDWFTKKEGFGEVAYPAPYDQPFYMILNLAVGGNWPGDPDENTFAEGNETELVVDYVRVYRKDDSVYEEMNPEKPEKEVILRDPDETGNYIINGDFAKVEDLTTSDNWQLHLEDDGAATTEISEKALHITTTKAGALDYSVQVVQANLPLEKGYQYKLSFDAYADEARTMITGITAPDVGYMRYLNDTTVNLTTESDHYEYVFDMTSSNDANGRVEFNLGNQNSTAGVHITNVRLEKTDETVEVPDDTKSVLPDGNYVYNGQFEEGNEPGKVRLAYWDWDVVDGTSVSVTTDSKRKLKVVVPDGVTDLSSVVVKQTPIAITGGKTYVFTFDAYADKAKTIQSTIGGQTFETALTTERTSYKYAFDTAEDLNGSELQFLLGTAGTTYIDNVRIQEDGLLVNGDFSAGMVGYELYVNSPAVASAIVDSLTEEDACCITIDNTGTQDWHIQLLQRNIKLENGTWYKLSFDAKSTLDRTIQYALQRDGNKHNDDWTPYSGTQKIDLSKDFQNYAVTFQMTEDTDAETILSITMGAVNGTQISDKHVVTIDNIKLEETEEPVIDPVEPGDNLIQNGNFADGDAHWTKQVLEPADAEVSFADGKATFDIKNVGTNDYDVQLKQSKLTLEKGAEYQVSYKIKSSEARTVLNGFLTPTYKYYGGKDLVLEAGVEQDVEYTFTVSEATNREIDFYFSMGQISGKDTPASKIEISDIVVIKTKDGDGEEEPDIEPVEPGTDLIKNGDFSEGQEPWINGTYPAGEAIFTVEDSKAVYTITNVGTVDSNVQLKQEGLTLEKGQSYQVTFTMESSVDRTARFAFLTPSYDWYGGGDIELKADTEVKVDQKITVGDDKATSDKIVFQISMGYFEGDDTAKLHTIKIDDVKVVKLGDSTGDDEPGTDPEPDPEEPDESDLGEELIKNGDFSSGQEPWEDGTYNVTGVTTDFTEGKAVYNITTIGTAGSGISLEQKGLTLEKGTSYWVTFKIKSDVARKVKYAFLDPTDNKYTWYGGAVVNLEKDVEKVVKGKISVSEETVDTITFQIAMGIADDGQTTDPGKHTIEIDDVSVRKILDGSGEDPGTDPEEPEEPDESDLGEELITNGDFANGDSSWNDGTYNVTGVTTDFTEGKAVYNITTIEATDSTKGSGINLEQSNLTMEQGASYWVTFKIKSDVARKVKYAFLDPTDNKYTWYGGAVVNLEKDVEKVVKGKISVSEETVDTITFQIAMGIADDGQTTDPGKHTIEIDDVSVRKILDGSGEDPGTDPDPDDPDDPDAPEDNLIQNGDFKDGTNGWVTDGAILEDVGAKGTFSVVNKKAQFVINQVGTAEHAVQLKQGGIELKNGQWYEISFDAQSTADRKVIYLLQEDGTTSNNWTTYSNVETIDLTSESENYSHQFQMKSADSNNVVFCIKMGQIDGNEELDPHTITIDNVILKEIEAPEIDPDDPDMPEIGIELITNGDFANGTDGWITDTDGAINNGGEGTFTVSDRKALFNIKNVGSEDYSVQLKQTGLTLVRGQWYEIQFDAQSDIDRNVIYLLQEDGEPYTPYSEIKTAKLTGTSEHYSLKFQMTYDTSKNVLFCIKMGAKTGNDALDEHNVTIENVSLKAIAAPEDNSDAS